MEFILKYKWYILGALILLLIWYYFYKKGKGATTIVKPPVDTPGGTSSNNNPVGVGDVQIKMMVDNAHADAVSYPQSFLGHNADNYSPLASLSDTDFVKAYDIWNNEYQTKDAMTMRGMIDSLYGWWSDGIAIGPVQTFGGVRTILDDKFNRLGLR